VTTNACNPRSLAVMHSMRGFGEYRECWHYGGEPCAVLDEAVKAELHQRLCALWTLVWLLSDGPDHLYDSMTVLAHPWSRL